MKLGERAMEALRAEVAGRLQEGDSLVAAGAAALEGTALLVKKERAQLKKIFSEGFLHDAEKCAEIFGVKKESIISKKEQCHAVCAMGTGGVLCALWKMAEASGMGLEVDLRQIPIRQETIEICERFDLDPYRLLSGGSVLLGTDRGRELADFFCRSGIPAAVIGSAVRGNDRILYSGKITRFLDRPGQDEITKMPWGAGWRTIGIFPGQERKNAVWQD